MTDEQALFLAERYRIDHSGDYHRNPSEHTRDLLLFVRAIEQAARREALEEAAVLIETTHETTTIVAADETKRHLTPRRHYGDLTGMTWAAAIRALIGEDKS